MNYQRLYIIANSKASTKNSRGFWLWTTNPSIYAMSKGITILRTKYYVDVTTIKYDAANSKYVVKSKGLQRKLLSMCEQYNYSI
jgi:hypothetical protein